MTLGFIYIVDQPNILRDCVKMGRTGDNATLKPRYTTYYPKCEVYTYPVNNMESAEKFLFEIAGEYRIYPENELFSCSLEKAKEFCEQVKKIDDLVYNTRDEVSLLSRYIELTGLTEHPLQQKITEIKNQEGEEELDEHFIALNGKVYRLLECQKDNLSKLYNIKDNIVRKICSSCKESLKSICFRKLRATASDAFCDKCKECEKQKALE